MPIEFDFLYLLQSLRSDLLDRIMVFFTNIGDRFTIWILISLILVFFKKTRKCGLLMMVGMLIAAWLGEEVMKNLFKRVRPCNIDYSFLIPIRRPRDYSFPSGHSFHSFVSAVTIFLHFKKAGIAALLLAAVIAFSRLYLFVHFPTDVLGGMLLGTAVAVAVFYLHKLLAMLFGKLRCRLRNAKREDS